MAFLRTLKILSLELVRLCLFRFQKIHYSRVNNVSVPYVFAPRRAGDIAENYADPSKAKELLGWEAEKDLEDMCRDSYRFQRDNPKGYKG